MNFFVRGMKWLYANKRGKKSYFYTELSKLAIKDLSIELSKENIVLHLENS